MVGELVDYVRRPVTRVIVTALLVAYPTVALIQSLLSGFVLTPLTQPVQHSLAATLIHQAGQSPIAGREVDWLTPFSQLVEVAITVAIAGWLWIDRPKLAAVCGHCTSPVPEAASVCWTCARELHS